MVDCVRSFRIQLVSGVLALIAALAVSPTAAVTSLVYDVEPNDTPQQAVPIALPDGRDVLRIMGELEAEDQDAYRLIVDEDHAGRRFNLRLTGRAGALTQLDIFDFSEVADGRGRIPDLLTAPPAKRLTLKATDGGRPAQLDAFLFPPGTYVIGISQSGGQGAYVIELVENDGGGVRVLDDEGTSEAPLAIVPNRHQVVWTQGETWFSVDLNASQAEQAWGLQFQTALGLAADATLYGPDDEVLLELASDGQGMVERPGLELAAGRYRIRTRQAEAGVQWIGLPADLQAVTDGREQEPNDRVPNRVAFGEPVQGQFHQHDSELLAFTVDEPVAARRWNLVLETGPESQVDLCLLRPGLSPLQHCKRGRGRVEHFALGFAPGDYTVRMNFSGPPGDEWRLAWTDIGPVQPGQELEPNDDHRHASPLHDRGFGRGRFDAGMETDHWRFSVTGEPQLWRIQLQGDSLHELYLKNVAGDAIAKERNGGQQRIRLENQYLMPGEYLIAASGTDSDYTLRVQPLGPPPPGMEREPNDALDNGQRMRFGQEYFGLLAEDGDIDVYRFVLHGDEHVRLRVQSPADGMVRTVLQVGNDSTLFTEFARSSAPGGTAEWSGFLPPGDYTVSLSAHQVSDAEYRLVLERDDWLAAPVDREPNDWADGAAPFPHDGVLVGRVGQTRWAVDWYALPEVDAPTAISLPIGTGLRLNVVERNALRENLLQRDAEAGVFRATLEPGLEYRLAVQGNGEYRLDLSALAGPSLDGMAPILELELPDVAFQAYSPWAQRLEGALVVSNPAEFRQQIELAAHLTDRSWTLDGLPDTLTLEAGETTTLPLTVVAAPDAAADRTVQLTMRAGGPSAFARHRSELAIEIDAAPLAPSFHWPLTPPLRGAFNAAAAQFGGAIAPSPNVPDDKLDGLAPMIDGLTRFGRWTESAIRTTAGGPANWQQPTIRLAGDAPVPVQGFLLDPTSTIHTNRMLRDFEVALSLDGEQFETVLSGRLDPDAAEQAFLLAAPVDARYARLIPRSGSIGDTASLQELKIGEFKVVAAPGWRPQDAPFDLAAPVNGGHLVWAEPWLRESAYERSMLQSDDAAPYPRAAGRRDATLVFGFHHARVARLQGVAIEPMPVTEYSAPNPTAVRLLAATASPLGPWTLVAESELGDEPVTIDFETLPWARYLRFDFDLVEGVNTVQFPDRVQIFEAEGDSILAEWGVYSPVGPFEVADTPRPPEVATRPANRSRETALPLSPGQIAYGRALLDDYASWYRIEPDATANRLELRLAGRPSLEGAPRLFDAAGREVDLFALENDGVTGRWEAWIEPGGEHWLEVFEPPRSVIFSWDTSASVAAYLPTIRAALISYAESIRPGRDEVNLLPFGYGRPLLANWQGHAYPLIRMLAANPQETSSSEAESALAAASRALTGRPGKKAVLLLTDAATNTSEALWPAAREGRPQVFAMKLTSEGAFSSHPDVELDLMQDWARIRGGHFQYITGFGSLVHGFERAVAWLKRPVDFEVEVAMETVDDPSPATIEVTAGETGVTPEARGAVEIILDASGSMLKRMGGERRIEIAKAAIRDTVQNTLPDGIPLALRVYGHREAGSCRTDLERPLAPLDKAAFLQQLDGIQAINLARTPIADSLAAVASDLANAEGRRLVILLTDGEETCDGDPAAAIEALAEQGVDVRINIVGFAIDDEALKDEFRSWAELGGGEYLDAAEAEALGSALEQSLRIPFEVIDESGEVVTAGFVGEDPVEVPAGRYSVRIRAAQDRWVRDLQLAPGDARRVPFDVD